MKKVMAALALIILPASHAMAGVGCQTTTGGSGIVLEKIKQNATGPELFGCINRSFDVLASSGVPTRSTNSWLVEGRIDVSTIGANGAVPAVYFSSGVHIGAASGLVDDYGFSAGSASIAGGLTASSGTFTATGAAQYSVQTSSGIDLLAGTLRVEGPGGINSTFGSRASTYTATAMGNTVYSLVTSTGINMQAGTFLAQGPIQGTATGNATPSLILSSGATIGSDVHVTGTLEATKLKGDGSQLTGIGGGGTVTTQGSPAAGYMAAFQGSSAISTAPYYVTPDSMTALVPVSFSTGVNIAQYAKFSSSAPSASMGAGAMWLDSSSGRINYLDANNLQIELDPAVVFATTYSTGTVTRAIGPPSNDKLCFTPGHHSFSDGTPGLGCADALGGLPFGISGTVKRLTCWHSSALGASNTWTLRKNGSSTGNACTDSAIAASCSVSESLVIVSTDIVSVQQTAGATLTNGGCMIAVVPGVQ
jgi:hypothetical protein